MNHWLNLYLIALMFFLFLYDVVLFYFLYLGIRRYPFKSFQLLIFFALFHIYYISGHRQAMAMVIFLYNFNNFIEKKYLRFSILFILSYLFHRSSALYLIPCLLLYFFDFKRRDILILSLLSSILVCYDFLGMGIEYLYRNYSNVSYIFGRVYYYYYVQYSGGKINTLNYIKVFSIYVMVLYFYNKINRGFGLMIFLYFIIFFIFFRSGGLAFRISEVFLIFSIPLFALLINELSGVNRVLMFFILVSYVSIVFLRIIYVHLVFGVNTFLPYKSIFDSYL